MIAKQGVPPETDWPYVISTFAQRPSQNAIDSATKSKAISYLRIAQDLNQLKICLAEGYPFVFGFTAYTSFESQAVATTGLVPLPGQTESTIGGHAVLAVGYDDSKQQFKIRKFVGTRLGC